MQAKALLAELEYYVNKNPEADIILEIFSQDFKTAKGIRRFDIETLQMTDKGIVVRAELDPL